VFKLGKSKKFKVGDSPRSLHKIGGHHIPGGTWLRPEDVGVPEEVLKKDYAYLTWEEEEKKEKKEVAPSKLSKEKFYDLIRAEQESHLEKLGIEFSKKDKEADLWEKYNKV